MLRTVILKSVLFFFAFFLCNEPVLSSESRISVEQIEQNQDLLKQIATAIFSREQDVLSIKKKLCNHGPEMIEAWKQGKTWATLDPLVKSDLQKMIKPNDIKSILRRKKHALVSDSIRLNPEQIKNIIHQGHMEVDRAPDTNKISIRISHDFAPNVQGILYDRTSGNIVERPSTKLYIVFDIQDIVDKITTQGLHGWNPEKDGRISTICVE